MFFPAYIISDLFAGLCNPIQSYQFFLPVPQALAGYLDSVVVEQMFSLMIWWQKLIIRVVKQKEKVCLHSLEIRLRAALKLAHCKFFKWRQGIRQGRYCNCVIVTAPRGGKGVSRACQASLYAVCAGSAKQRLQFNTFVCSLLYFVYFWYLLNFCTPDFCFYIIYYTEKKFGVNFIILESPVACSDVIQVTKKLLRLNSFFCKYYIKFFQKNKIEKNACAAVAASTDKRLLRISSEQQAARWLHGDGEIKQHYVGLRGS